MKILGIRNSPSSVRYAIIDGDKISSTFINKDEENKLVFPKAMKSIPQKICWYKSEIDRIILAHGPFDAVALKHNENVQSNYSRLQETMYYDAITSLIFAEKSVRLEYFTYKSMKTNSKSILAATEPIYGKTSQHWDVQIADAIYACTMIIGE
mgnify:CR=1 FL=1